MAPGDRSGDSLPVCLDLLPFYGKFGPTAGGLLLSVGILRPTVTQGRSLTRSLSQLGALYHALYQLGTLVLT